MEINEKIAELENELALAKSLLFSKKGVVDIKKCEDLIYDIKRSLPTAIQEASYLLGQRDAILRSAEKEAGRILDEAKHQAEHLVETSEIVKKSEQIARENMEFAEKQCANIYSTTKSNIDIMLKHIEDYLGENLHIVRNNREELAGAIFTNKNKPKK